MGKVVNLFKDQMEPKELFKNVGLDTNFLQMSNYLFKRADVQMEMVPAKFPYEILKVGEKCHFMVIDAKRNVENVIVESSEEKRVDIHYYFTSGQALKIAVKEDLVDGENDHIYQYVKNEVIEKAFKDKGQNIEVAVNQIVQMVAILIGLKVKDYSLEHTLSGIKIRTKNTYKSVGDIKLISRVMSTYICKAYPFYMAINWEQKKDEWHERNGVEKTNDVSDLQMAEALDEKGEADI